MVLASLNLVDLLWTMIVLFFLFIMIMILFQIFADLFRDESESGVGKAIWVIFLIFFTPITMLVYLIVKGRGMAERSAKAQADAQAQFNRYIQDVSSGGGSPADQIAKAKSLLDQGAIDQAEFDRLKAQALNG